MTQETKQCLSQSNIDAWCAISRQKTEIENYIVQNTVFEIFKEVAEKFGMSFDKGNVLSRKCWCLFSFYNNKKRGICFTFKKANWNILCVGLLRGNKSLQLKKDKPLDGFNFKPNDSWFYGWKCLEDYQTWNSDTLLRIYTNPNSFKNYMTNVILEIIIALKNEHFDLENLPDLNSVSINDKDTENNCSTEKESNMQDLLSSVSSVVERNKVEIKEKQIRGENFNIFRIIHLQSDERCHSSFISNLLDPKGDHGCKDRFLKEFIDTVEVATKDFNTENAIVRYEDTRAGTINNDYTEGGRMDITIESGDQIIIIENKIYADDQKNQLVRYENYAKKFYKEDKYTILYLTLYGSLPRDYATNKKEINNLQCVGYNFHILNWINRCIEISAEKPIVRETLVQYRDVIKYLTGMQESKVHSEEIIRLMLKYASASRKILNVEIESIIKHIFDEFVKDSLSQISREYGMKLEITPNIHKLERKRGIIFSFDEGEFKDYQIKFYTKGEKNKFWVAVTSKNENKDKPKHKLNFFREEPTETSPFGWHYLDEPYTSFGYNVFPSMVNGEYTRYIKESLRQIIDELRIYK